MAKLSVNVNKIATLRNARGGDNPNLLQMTRDIVKFGAHGITVHPRPDGRHIRKSDVYLIAEELSGGSVEFNIEGYPSRDFIKLSEAVRPQQVTLVPDPPDVLTSNAGWHIKSNETLLREVVAELKDFGCRVSLFFDPYDFRGGELELAQKIGADRIELYTEAYAKAFVTSERDNVFAVYQRAAQEAVRVGLGLNAGHDLDSQNLAYLAKNLAGLQEVSIGHALVCDALYWGLEKTVKVYLDCLQALHSDEPGRAD